MVLVEAALAHEARHRHLHRDDLAARVGAREALAEALVAPVVRAETRADEGDGLLGADRGDPHAEHATRDAAERDARADAGAIAEQALARSERADPEVERPPRDASRRLDGDDDVAVVADWIDT